MTNSYVKQNESNEKLIKKRETESLKGENSNFFKIDSTQLKASNAVFQEQK